MIKEDAIAKILKENADIAAIVEQRIFPIVAPAGTKFPYITYSSNSAKGNGTKDGNERNVIFSIGIVDKSYRNAHVYANLIEPCFLADDAQDIAAEAELYNPDFEQESDAYNLNIEAYMVTVDVSFDQEI